MNWSDIDRHPSDAKVRQFAALWLLVFGALALWRWNGAVAAIAVAGGLAGLASPRLLRPLFVGLTMATFPIGWLVSRLLLAVVFFGVVTPVGLLLRAAGKDPLRRKRRDGSHWTAVDSSRKMPGSYLRQF